ncbi:MAG TPA: hypothetical protein IAC14_14185 [Candidatus Scybalomonas excrementigallinarum]|nr:hypothetical protein [Candidatus Scybalomonas excrementigallinarum]
MEKIDIIIILVFGGIIAFFGISILAIAFFGGFIPEIIDSISKLIENKKAKETFKNLDRYQESIRITEFLKENDMKKMRIDTLEDYFWVLGDLIFSLRDICDYNGKNITEDMKFILNEITKKEFLSMNEQLFNTWLLETACIKYHLNESKLDQEQTERFLFLKGAFEEEKERIEVQKKEEIKDRIRNTNKLVFNETRKEQKIILDKKDLL